MAEFKPRTIYKYNSNSKYELHLLIQHYLTPIFVKNLKCKRIFIHGCEINRRSYQINTGLFPEDGLFLRSTYSMNIRNHAYYAEVQFYRVINTLRKCIRRIKFIKTLKKSLIETNDFPYEVILNIIKFL
jgi:hypothetical protein